jgi:hypothetical protein
VRESPLNVPPEMMKPFLKTVQAIPLGGIPAEISKTV